MARSVIKSRVQQIREITNADLRVNGGRYRVESFAAIPAYFVDDQDDVEFHVQAAYLVTDEMLTVNGGPFRVEGGPAVPMVVAPAGEPPGFNAVPIYVVGNDTGAVLPGGEEVVSSPYDDTPSIVDAYGLRRLLSAYEGMAIRVRRTSDNAENDFGFDGNNDLDAAAVATFIGASSGTIVRWYDQSGNSYDAIQATATSQPLYVDAGQNGHPMLYFDGDDQLLNTTDDPVVAGTDYSVIYAAVADVVGDQTNGGGTLFTLRRTTAYGATMLFTSGGNTYIYGDGVSSGANVRIEHPATFKVNFFIGSSMYTGAGNNPALFINGVSEPVITPSTAQTTPSGLAGFRMGHSGAAGQFWVGHIAEMIVTSNVLSTADREAAEVAANAYWAAF